jgi:hypothetical protein
MFKSINDGSLCIKLTHDSLFEKFSFIIEEKEKLIDFIEKTQKSRYINPVGVNRA